MRPLLWRASVRHLLRHPWQLALAVVGVALGVAVVVGIDVANGSAQRAFELSSDTVAGEATHHVVGPGGELPENVYRKLRVDLGLDLVAPVVEGHVGVVGESGDVLLLLGIDPLAETPFRSFVAAGTRSGGDLGTFLTRPGAALMAPATTQRLAIAVDDRFDVDIGGAVRTLELVGYLEAGSSAQEVALQDLVVVDVATAQETLGTVGRLSRIDAIRLPGMSDDEFAALVEPALGQGVQLLSVRSRASTVEQMTRAFRLNLQALSLLALLCGAFLIFNTMTFAVVQRRPLLAILRALGTTRGQIFGLILSEALLIGAIGTAFGEIAGVQLGRMLIARVTQTINDLYFVVNVREVSIAPWTLVKGGLLGLAATLAAAITPSIEATGTDPREALVRSELEARVHRAVPLFSMLGALLLAVGSVLLALPGGRLWLGFAGLFAILVGFALLTPLATKWLMRVLTPVAGRVSGQLGKMATRGVVTALSRTGIAIAALMMALSVTVGVDLMVRSFRGTVTRWLEYALPADLYLSVFTTPARRFSPGGAVLDQVAIDGLRDLDEVAAVNLLRHFLARVDGEDIRAVALELSAGSRQAFDFRSGDPESIWDRLEAGEGLMISEPLAYRRGLAEGDTLEILSPRGALKLPVAGVFYDYSTEQGLLMLDRLLYRRHWGDEGTTAVSAHLAPGVDAETAKARIRALLPADLRVRLSSNAELRRESLRIFDRTFVITGVLRTLAVIVAFVGVLSALLALQLERTRELGVMRACGLTPGQLWCLVTQQTGLMGLTAGLLSLPVGVSMAAIMIHVINRRSFGWTLEMDLFPLTLVQAVALGVGAAILAGVYPAWRMSRTRPSEALRDE
jgi:putative ABC transport system permease protein